jgi:hypothetical protein
MHPVRVRTAWRELADRLVLRSAALAAIPDLHRLHARRVSAERLWEQDPSGHVPRRVYGPGPRAGGMAANIGSYLVNWRVRRRLHHGACLFLAGL